MKEGWKMVKLTDISENLDYMRVPITKNVREVGKYPYYGASGIVDYVNDYIYDEDLLLISEDGANLLARTTPIAFSVSGKIWVNNHAHVLRFKSLTTQKFVEYFIAGFNIKAYVTGMAQPKLNQRALEKIKLPLPPLEEQHRIVSILDASFEKIDALKKNAEENLKNAKALFQQVLAQELKPKEGWVEKKLEEVSKEIFAGGDAPKQNMSKTITEQYPIPIYANAVEEDGLYGFTDNARVNEPAITVAARGSGTGYVLRRKKPFLPIVRLIVIIPNPSIEMDYMYYALKSINIRKAGAAIPQLTVPMLREYKISLPTNIEEQHRIVRTLDTLSEKCRRLEQVAQQTICECDALKQSILRQAFSGEL